MYGSQGSPCKCDYCPPDNRVPRPVTAWNSVGLGSGGLGTKPLLSAMDGQPPPNYSSYYRGPQVCLKLPDGTFWEGTEPMQARYTVCLPQGFLMCHYHGTGAGEVGDWCLDLNPMQPSLNLPNVTPGMDLGTEPLNMITALSEGFSAATSAACRGFTGYPAR